MRHHGYANIGRVKIPRIGVSVLSKHVELPIKSRKTLLEITEAYEKLAAFAEAKLTPAS